MTYKKSTAYSSISLIIVNKNDRAIANTLSKLLKIHSLLPYEVIVVDASSGALNDIRDRFQSIKWYAFKPSTKRTIAQQRNYGIKKSTGDIVVFIDASCVPIRDWLVELTKPIIYNNEFIVAGSTVSGNGNTIHDLQKVYRRGKRYLDECATVNLALVRKTFNTVGYFDEELGYAEDVDFTWRAVDSGYKICYSPKAEVTHEWGDVNSEMERSFRYGIGRAKLYKKHIRRWRALFTKDSTALVYPVYIIGLPITLLFWPYPLLILVPIVKNIKKMPFKIVAYNLIYGLGVIKGLVTL